MTSSHTSLTLLTDLYQLTMANGYWKLGRSEQQAVFHLFFRKQPFSGGYTIAAGLQPVVAFLEAFRFDDDDLQYLSQLPGNDGAALFGSDFLGYLQDLRLTVDVDAIPEGTVVFPHEPLLRVRGPILQCQLLETALLNIINFQSLIATKSARICHAAQGDPVLEFGLRRAQGIDGALAASRAAFIGGCAATSNVLAGKTYGIPVKGTHAHSWVMSFDDELAAFDGYSQALPNNCVFLVDTYDTLQGVRTAIEVGHQLRSQGHEMIGIRLDSGDLAYLSIEARKLLDAAGFEQAAIVASNDLDEHTIASLKQQGAKIGVWGVGTKLVTGDRQPALGGVYKLAAIKKPDGTWEPKVKLSEQLIKVSTPGLLQVRREYDAQGVPLGDMIYNELEALAANPVSVDPMDPTRRRSLKHSSEDLLIPVLRHGSGVGEFPSLPEIRQRTLNELSCFHRGILRTDNPHLYPVGLELQLFELKTELVRRARGDEANE